MPSKDRVSKKVVDERVARLGAHLQLARVRRGLSMKQAGALISASENTVREIERGNAATSIRVAVALLELFGLADELERLADPARDTEGLRLGGPQLRKRARRVPASASPAAPAPAPRATARDAVALPESITRLLSPTELSALSFVQRRGAVKTLELAEAVGLKPNRLIGLMRELRRKLVDLERRDFLVIENLNDGDVLFEIKKGAGA